MAKKKTTHRQKLSTTTVTDHPQTPPGVAEPPRHRKLRARATNGTFLLLDGIRYFASLEEPREGTLARIMVTAALFCTHHRAEVIDQTRDELRHHGAASVHERGGTVWSFWPAEIPREDVAETVAHVAAEFGMPNSITPDEYRPDVIYRMVAFGPPQSVRAA